MAVQEQIKACLAEFFPVYEQIGELLGQTKELQQAEQAQGDYKLQTTALDEEARQLEAKKNDLEAAKRLWKLKAEGDASNFRPPLSSARTTFDAGPASPLLRERLRPATSNQEALQHVRSQLTKLVGRWGPSWKLSLEVQGQINRIADDPAKPLGEALVLLEWRTFERPYGKGETDENHLERIKAWGAALLEYRERLNGEIDMLKTKYRRVIPILAAWIARDTESGRKSWERQVSETNAARRADVEKLQQEIVALTNEVELLKRPQPVE